MKMRRRDWEARGVYNEHYHIQCQRAREGGEMARNKKIGQLTTY